MGPMNWDEYFLELAFTIAKKSKDPISKVGCVIVGPNREIRSTGYNGFPRWCDDNIEERYERPDKLFYTEHSERNAIYNAARHGVALDQCWMYITGPPCADCARAIIQSGIEMVFYPEDHFLKDREDWADSLRAAEEMLKEAGVGTILL